MHRILKAEMVRADISVKQLALQIGITERSLRNKINGITEFTLSESIRIKKVLSIDMEAAEKVLDIAISN